MYPTTYFFSIPSSAFVALACLNVFIGIVTTLSTYILELFTDQVSTSGDEKRYYHESFVYLLLYKNILLHSFLSSLFKELQDIAGILKQVYLVFPHYCLGRGLMDLFTNQLAYETLAKFGEFLKKTLISH